MAYTRRQRADKGFDFFTDKGQKTTIEEYVKNTGANKNRLIQDLAAAGDKQSQRQVIDMRTQQRQNEVFNPAKIAGDIGKASSDFAKLIGSGIQQGIGSAADVALQGGQLIGRLGIQSNPLINEQQRQAQLQREDMRLAQGGSTEALRSALNAQKDITGKNIVGTRDVDNSATAIAGGRGTVRDFMAVGGKGLDVGLSATMFANPTALARGSASQLAGRQVANQVGKEALLYGGLDAASAGSQTFGQTGDLGQSLAAAGQAGLLSGVAQGALGGIGYGLSKAPRAARQTAEAVNEARPSVIARNAAAQDPRVQGLETEYANLAQKWDNTADPVARKQVSEAMVAIRREQQLIRKGIQNRISQRGSVPAGNFDPSGRLGEPSTPPRGQSGSQLDPNPGRSLEVPTAGTRTSEELLNKTETPQLSPRQGKDLGDLLTSSKKPIAKVQAEEAAIAAQGSPQIGTQRTATQPTELLETSPSGDIIPRARNPREAAGVDDGVLAINEARTIEAPRIAKSKYASETLQGSDQVAKEIKKSLRKDSPEYQVETEKQRFTESAKRREEMGDEAFTKDVRSRLETKSGTADSQTIADAQTAAARADADGDYVTATEIYDKLSEHLTKAGQTIQAAAVLARRNPDGLRFHAQKTLKKAGIELTPERQRALASYVAEVKKTQRALDDLLANKANNVDIRAAEEAVAVARENVQYYVASQIPSKTADKIVNFWRSGLLTAPTTTAGAVLGNSETFFVRKLWTNPAAAMADWAMSAFTGKRTQSFAKPGEFGKGAIEDGIKKGLSKQYWKTGRDAMMDGQKLGKYDQPIYKLNYGQGKLGKAMGGYVNGVYSLMGAADKPFRYGAYRESLSSQARAAIDTMRLQKQKISRQEARKLYDDFMDNPPPEAAQRATDEALYETFQNDTIPGQLISNMKQWAKREGHSKTAALMDFIMPFTGVPSSIATRVIQRTPVGTANEIVKQIIAVKKGGAFDQRAMARAIGEGTAGIPIIAAGAALAGAGQITGGFPRDEKTRNEWEQTGKQPNSVKIGDRWYSLNYLQPFGTLLALGETIGTSIKDEDQLHEVIVKGAAAAANSVVSMSFLDGISNALSIVTEGASESSVARWTGNTVASTVPNLIRSFARSADDTQRDTKGDNFLETVGKSFVGAIPGARTTLPAKTDQFGQPLPAKDNFFNQFLNPFRPSKSIGNDDPTVQEMSRLLSVDQGVKPTEANKATFKDNELSYSQIKEINELAGPKLKDEYDKLIQSEGYAQLSDEDKVKAIKKINSVVFGSIKAQWGLENGLVTQEDIGKLDSNQKRYLQGSDINYITGGIGDTKLDSKSSAYSFLDSRPELTDDEKKNWYTQPIDPKYQPMLDAVNQKLPEGLPALPATNRVAELYAEFEKKRADENWSELQTKRESNKFAANAYKSELTENESFISTLSDDDIISAYDNGDVAREELDRIAALDVVLNELGLEATLGKKARNILGYGALTGGKAGRSGTKGFTPPKTDAALSLQADTYQALSKLLGQSVKPRAKVAPRKVALKEIKVKGA